jgi:hypothetical protein
MKRRIVAFKEAMERVRSGAAREEEVRLPSGDRVRLVHDPRTEAGYRIEPVSEGGGSDDPFPQPLLFEQPGLRPPEYPDDLPFLPGQSVSFLDQGPGGARLLAWSTLSDETEALETIRAQLDEEGWVLVRDTSGSGHGLRTIGLVFQKGGMERFFLLSRRGESFHLMMREYRKEPDERGAPPFSGEAG